jgi:hypothetical protein
VTERKPPGVSWQSWIDRQIDEARANGEFDDLPGHGKPLAGVDRPRDELWWVRDKLRREGVEYLPPALAIRKQAAEAREQALAARSEADARRILEHINAAIRHLNRSNVDGPPTTLTAFDVDEVLDERRRRHAEHAEQVDERAAPPAPPPEPVPGRPPRRRWRLGRGRSR